MIDSLVKYLSNRPIASILEKSDEKDDLKALKLMSIIDYYVEQRFLYANMENQPKLKQQLMQFRSYANFKYYDCQVNRAIGKRLLQCKFCELIAPYAYILTHMAISHQTHISTKTCAYCNRKDIIAHSSDNSLQMCYDEYLKKNEIRPESIKTDVIVDFFKLIKDIAKTLGVVILRNESFAGIGYPHIEKIANPIRNFPTTCTVFSPKNSNKGMNDVKLENYFHMVIGFMLGGNGISRLTQGTTGNDENEEDIITLSSDDEDQQRRDNTQQKPNNAPRTITPVLDPSVMVKIERDHGRNESPANHIPIVSLPKPTVTREPVAVTQVRDETPHRFEEAPENEQQPQPAGNNMTTNGPQVREVNQPQQQQNKTQQPQKYESPENDFKVDPNADHFGRYVASRLSGINNKIKRRKLELQIQQNIVAIESEEIDEIA